MPSLIAVNVVKVVMGYKNGGSELLQNVFYVHKATPWTGPELASLVLAFEGWEGLTAAPQRSSQVSCTRVTATDLTSLTSARVDDILTTPIPGTDASPVMPANVTFALKASIGQRGKGRNGRCFWIGLGETMVVEDQIVVASADNIQTALDVLITDVPAAVAGAELGIIHTRVNGAPISPATFSPTVAYVYTDLTIDSQRDRLPGHKKHKRPTP